MKVFENHVQKIAIILSSRTAPNQYQRIMALSTGVAHPYRDKDGRREQSRHSETPAATDAARNL